MSKEGLHKSFSEMKKSRKPQPHPIQLLVSCETNILLKRLLEAQGKSSTVSRDELDTHLAELKEKTSN